MTTGKKINLPNLKKRKKERKPGEKFFVPISKKKKNVNFCSFKIFQYKLGNIFLFSLRNLKFVICQNRVFIFLI